ncbi:MAG: Eco57I restriction-modification methylase domain-containing protein [Oligosphaeraceae bacterium]
MSLDLTGITNRNEYFTDYYLSAILEQDLRERLQAWSQDTAVRPPHERLAALHRDFAALEHTLRSSRAADPDERLRLATPFLTSLLNALGYDWRPQLRETAAHAIPIVAEALRPDGSPWLWAILTPAPRDEPQDPLDATLAPHQCDDEPDPRRRPLTLTVEDLIAHHIFALEHPPRWILALHHDYIVLVDRAKWNDKRMLSFNLHDILNLRNDANLKVVAALLHRDSLCPNAGSPLLDTLDENSHRHAFAVSEDLKYAAREAVELIANEAIWYIREKRKKAVFSLDDDLAARLTSESLRYLYRLLFLFYLEARAERHDTLPVRNDVYRKGYSLEALRDLELVPLTTPEMQDGYFFDDSIALLFRMVAEGVIPRCLQDAVLKTSLSHEFALERIECHLFDDTLTPTLKTVRLRNRVWQRIICLLSLTRERTGKQQRRGRVSYAQLGIIQLGAVYEGLLSYRGFFAKEDLYEVKKAGDTRNELEQAFFVTRQQLDDYTDDERCLDDHGNLIRYPKGTFIYRLAGRDRDRSASFYTPAALTRCLVKYALRELIGERPTDPTYKSAEDILRLTICEPAMGSAAFLNETVNQLADAYLRRRQAETGETIPHADIEEATQRVRMFLADRCVFGVDLNPVAVELAEISLWLNSMTRATFVPWFGGQLLCGNSLIGARRQVQLIRPHEKAQSWLSCVPQRVSPQAPRPSRSIYHFLLPDEGMANYDDKVIKTMEPQRLKLLKTWRKDFHKPFCADDVHSLERLSNAIDRLWDEHTQQLRDLRAKTTDRLAIFGHHEDESRNLTLAEKDRSLSNLYARTIHQSTPYRRLKMVMDYWCALWFWPIDHADLLPSRDEYLMELQFILQGASSPTFSAGCEANGQGLLFPSEERQLTLDFAHDLGTVDINDLCDTFPRLRIVRDLADAQRFLHWELEFADVFRDHGGFDLVLGNPPWVKIQWNEGGLLSDYQPLFAVRALSAAAVADLRADTIQQFGLRNAYLAEYETVTGTQSFLNALVNYPHLQGVQTNLYKCFLPQAWMLNAPQGVAAFVHPEGVYDDPKGGPLRQQLYPRLRAHFQFANELRLFADVHHETTFSLNVYGAPRQEPSFLHLANLYVTPTVDDCFLNTAQPVGGIKDDDGNWNILGHPDRLLTIGQEELATFAQLYDDPGTPWNEARLPRLHARQLTDVLEKLVRAPHHFRDWEKYYFDTACWDETNAVKKTFTIKRNTCFPVDAEQLILSGPHIYVGNPFYKTPRARCVQNSDYDCIDLTCLPADYLPRTNYIPDCHGSMDDYRSRLPVCPWDELIDSETGKKDIVQRENDYYRLAYRRMMGCSAERTMISALIQPGPAHINTNSGLAAGFDGIAELPDDDKHHNLLLDLAAFCFSVVGDFYIKTTGRTDLYWSSLAQLPRLCDDRLRLRVLLLSCLTRGYARLWEDAWRESFRGDGWAKDDPRLPRDAFDALARDWTWTTPLRTDYARRQALVELDVLVAQGLGLTLDELCAIYRIQFPVLRQNENDTWYDQTGRIVFTCSKGLPGVGFSRPEWEAIRHLRADDACPTRPRSLDWLPKERRVGVPPTIVYQPPFDRCDREQDYRTAWQRLART